MFTNVLPSIHALCSSDDSLLAREVSASRIRTQAAVVRTLLDEVDRLVPCVLARPAMSAHLSDEIMRLARGLVEAARPSDPASIRAVTITPFGDHTTVSPSRAY
ncbi:MAG: hypothetical protein ACMG6S_14385 [Byssovorax sp.]